MRYFGVTKLVGIQQDCYVLLLLSLREQRTYRVVSLAACNGWKYGL